MDVYVNGEPAGTWETATGNTVSTYHEIDVTGIEDLDALEEYFNETGVIPYEMVNGKKVYVTFAKLPQNNTAVSTSAINDIISIAGGSVVAGYNTEGMIAKLSKSLVLNAIMRTMFLVIEGNTVEQSILSQLENVLNPFCITGTNDVPLYVDSNGVAHVLADAVEAVRDKLIELGAYDSGSAIDQTLESFTHTYIGTIGAIDSAEFNAVKGDVSGVVLPEIRNNTQPVHYAVTCNASKSYLRFLLASQGEFEYRNSFTHRGGAPGTWYTAGTTNTYSENMNTSADRKTYYYGTFDVYPSNYDSFIPSVSDGVTSGIVTDNVSESNNWLPTLSGTTTGAFCALLAFCTAGSMGIAGMQAAAGMLAGFGDITMPLPDVWPDWYAKKKQVATPADDDLYLRSPALPLDVPVDNVFDDGYAGDSDDATDGDLEDILKQAIIDVLPDILADIIDNTAVTPEDVYDIPVDDGGNTPPAEPPVLDGSSNGLWTMYNPTKTQVNDFGAWLWSDTIIDQIIRQFNSPIDAIIGFHQIYCTPTTGAAKVIKAGYLNSPVSAAEVTDQYATIDCGTVHVDEFYGNVLDYDNSQVSMYLPFIGIVPLNTNVVMGSDLQIIYRIDVFTGTCLAQIKVIKQNSNAVMYAFDGNCAVQIPLTATTYTGMIGALISGISAGVSFATGDMAHAVTSGLSAAMSALNGQTGNKQSGTMGSNAGALGIRKPYLIITRAISSMPAGFESVAGLPSTDLVQLGSLSGFTSIRNVHLEGIPGTAEELEEIKSLLESGVIF